jgi:uncharacterized protein (DUF885 family)
MRKCLQTGFIQPKVVLKDLEDSVNAFIHDSSEDSIYCVSLHDLLAANVDTIQHQKLTARASYIAKKVDAKLSPLFNYLPRTPFGVD